MSRQEGTNCSWKLLSHFVSIRHYLTGSTMQYAGHAMVLKMPYVTDAHAASFTKYIAATLYFLLWSPNPFLEPESIHLSIRKSPV
jgi:hypothetical protein